MDQTDVQILECLRSNARQNASAIGAQVNLSVSAVIERIRKMENSGLIRQYSVQLDAEKINMGILAFILVNLEHPKYNDGFCELVSQNRRVVECHYITGDFDYILKVMASSTQMLERILNEIKSIQGVSQTRTLVVFSTVKSELGVLPEID